MITYEWVRDKTRENEFKQKLNALLKEYNVEMDVTTVDSAYCARGVVEFSSHMCEDAGSHFIDKSINFTIKEGVYCGDIE